MNGSQSAYIAGSIAFAFFVYITLKGELPVYAGLLLLSPKQAPAPQQAASNSLGASATQAAQIALEALAAS